MFVTLQDAVYSQPARTARRRAAACCIIRAFCPDFDAEPVIAMVGTRHASAYGLLQAKRLGYELGRYGAIVVSGGAAGIDTHGAARRRLLRNAAGGGVCLRCGCRLSGKPTEACLRIFAPTAAS